MSHGARLWTVFRIRRAAGCPSSHKVISSRACFTWLPKASFIGQPIAALSGRNSRWIGQSAVPRNTPATSRLSNHNALALCARQHCQLPYRRQSLPYWIMEGLPVIRTLATKERGWANTSSTRSEQRAMRRRLRALHGLEFLTCAFAPDIRIAWSLSVTCFGRDVIHRSAKGRYFDNLQ